MYSSKKVRSEREISRWYELWVPMTWMWFRRMPELSWVIAVALSGTGVSLEVRGLLEMLRTCKKHKAGGYLGLLVFDGGIGGVNADTN